MLGDQVIGPHFIEGNLNGNIYLNFLEEYLPLLLEDVPIETRQNMWYQHDGAPPHWSTNVREYLNQTFGNHWIGRFGPENWPPRSPDLTVLDYFVWGYVKSLCYEDPVTTEENLREKIVASFAQITPAMLASARENMMKRCDLCLQHGGGLFEPFLN